MTQSPFFCSMVLVGGSIALACGGTTDDGELGAGGAGEPSGGGDAAGGTSSTDPATGGQGTGGASTGGTGVGGTSPVEPGPFDCPPQTWACSDSLDCSGSMSSDGTWGFGYWLPDGCSCDASRPLEPSDCPSGTVFSCLDRQLNSSGVPLTERVLFSCECVPEEPDSSDYPYCDFEDIGDLRQLVCGCELPILK